MARKIRLLFATPEAHPLIKTGGLGDVGGALPPALASQGVDARILLPGYPQVLDALHLRRVRRDITVLESQEPVHLLSGKMPDSGIPVYVIESPSLYSREGNPYQGANGKDWPDNAQRFAVLARMAARLASDATPLRWCPDILHLNDWQTGLAAAYLAFDPGRRAKSVISIHNLAFPGTFPPHLMGELELPWHSYQMHGLEFYQYISYLKAGLFYADHISTVSPGYAQEIQQSELGAGFHGLLHDRQADLTGILNGIDTEVWNPAKDTHLKHRYSAARLAGKTKNRSALRKQLGLKDDPKTALVGVVARLTDQKGADLIPGMMKALKQASFQLVLLGGGDKTIEKQLTALAASMPDRFSLTLGYNEPLAHQIEAGADIFLMPSRYEPCGLNQMYSMRYGTLPLVRHTGGLADTVVDATPEALHDGTATGFVFKDASATALSECLERALALYAHPRVWRGIQKQAMARDFGWEQSAKRYVAMYRELLA